MAPRYSPEDPRFIWVGPQDEACGDGSFNRPFGRISSSLSHCQPGQTIVLKAGTYQGDVTIQACGSFDKPIRIVADDSAEAIVAGSCWYFYDVSDVIVSGLTFKDSSAGAIAVIGACERNRFESLKFLNCGCSDKASSTFFFGGAGATCNIVEYCLFERRQRRHKTEKRLHDVVVGLMISEGDTHEGLPIKDHIIRNNRFSNYDYAILVGADDATTKQYGHLIAYNIIDNCTSEGIMVKCGDTHVKGNVLRNCTGNSISIVTGQGTVVEDNRIVDSGLAIRIAGKGHTVSNNCIIRCEREAIKVTEPNSAAGTATENIIIEQNTCVGWSRNDLVASLPGISIGLKTNAIVKKNLFSGKGIAYRVDEISGTTGTAAKKQRHLITDNISSETCETMPGVIKVRIDFSSEQNDDYKNESGYGAKGWMCGPELYDPADENTDDLSMCEAPIDQSDNDTMEEFSMEFDENDVLSRSLFLNSRENMRLSTEQDLL